MKKFLLSFIVIFSAVNIITAQENPFGDTNFDTATIADDTTFSSFTETETKDEAKPVTFLPYVKFNPPMDTITELVTYLGVVPFTPLANEVYDGGTIDSLYWRAKKYLLEKYNKDYRKNSKNPKDLIFPKDMLVEDYKPDGDVGRIIITPTVPLVIRQNEYASVISGTITFKIDIRVKDEKYRYKFTNFVHHTKEKTTEKPIDNYIEFYVNSKHNIRSNDAVLKAVDRMVKEILKELAKVMKDPVVKDENDF
jgi:hypothetical protein